MPNNERGEHAEAGKNTPTDEFKGWEPVKVLPIDREEPPHDICADSGNEARAHTWVGRTQSVDFQLLK